MKKFWNWVQTDEGREICIDGCIAEESWWDDEVTPDAFKSELESGSGPVCVRINSPGGDCIAASMIYTMLMDYKDDVTVKIDGIAASAASVIAMAGTRVKMSPTSMIMIHNPLTFAVGDSEEMRRAMKMLDEAKESIINAYEIKTGLSRVKIAHLMDEETWMNARMAIELGFADEMMYEDRAKENGGISNSFAFSRKAADARVYNKITAKPSEQKEETVTQRDNSPAQGRVNAASRQKRLALLK